MDELLAKVPKPWLIALILIGAVIFIFAANPLHTPCDSQLALFLKAHEKELTPKQRSEDTQKSQLQLHQDECRKANSTGGCEPFFRMLRPVVKDLRAIPAECSAVMANQTIVQLALYNSLKLFIQLAWGFEPPVSSGDRVSWMEPPDLTLFCRARALYQQYYTDQGLKAVLKAEQSALPGTTDMPEDELWRKSILGVDCRLFER